MLASHSDISGCMEKDTGAVYSWNSAFEKIRKSENYTVERSYVDAAGVSRSAAYEFSEDMIHITGDETLRDFDFSAYLTDALPESEDPDFLGDIDLQNENIDHDEFYFIRTSDGGTLYLRLIDPDIWIVTDIQKDITGYLAFHVLDRIQMYEGCLNRETLSYDPAAGTYSGERIDTHYAERGEEKVISSLEITMKNGWFESFIEKGEKGENKEYTEEIRIRKHGETWIRLPRNVFEKEMFVGNL